MYLYIYGLLYPLERERERERERQNITLKPTIFFFTPSFLPPHPPAAPNGRPKLKAKKKKPILYILQRRKRKKLKTIKKKLINGNAGDIMPELTGVYNPPIVKSIKCLLEVRVGEGFKRTPGTQCTRVIMHIVTFFFSLFLQAGQSLFFFFVYLAFTLCFFLYFYPGPK